MGWTFFNFLKVFHILLTFGPCFSKKIALLSAENLNFLNWDCNLGYKYQNQKNLLHQVSFSVTSDWGLASANAIDCAEILNHLSTLRDYLRKREDAWTLIGRVHQKLICLKNVWERFSSCYSTAKAKSDSYFAFSPVAQEYFFRA